MNPVTEDILMHYGMPRRSGRYPWGSGEDPYQHAEDFLGRVEKLRKQGFTWTDENGKVYSGDLAIAKSMGLTSTQFRTEIGLANAERDMYELSRIKALQAKGLGYTAIGRELGMSESTVRSKLNPQAEHRLKKAQETADFLKERLEEFRDPEGKNSGMLDVGASANLELNISKEKLEQALYILQREGYGVYSGRHEQVTNKGKFTTTRVLCPPEIQPKGEAKAPADIYDPSRIHTLKDYISRDGGETYEKKFYYPASLDPKRVKVLLADEVGPDGEVGIAKDGIIQIRRGVPDLSLGESRYAQVRILVGEDKYLKGVAVYSDNMPDGIDVIFNSNKKKVEDAFKTITNDPDNPFGSTIKDADQGGQYWYNPDTGERVSANDPTVPNKKLGLINKRADEGDWTDWKDALPSQFLSKQSKAMAEKQLNLAKADRLAEFDDICALTNPTIKKHLLNEFANSCDSAAVHLQAAALPGQKYHVIVPINSLKDDEIYAPGYKDGTKLALVRYPHGGTFEIPILKVNNKNAHGKNIIGPQSIDAVGITSKVAERLSGADFDGDTVMCIPTHDSMGRVKITSTPSLKGLEGFDNRAEYGPHEVKVDPDGTKHYYQNGIEYPHITKRYMQTQMGVVSNLITDMTLAGDATDDEKAAAVRHSMVIIDSYKHHLNYKQSEIDNNIAALHKKYQGKSTGGAATVLSRAKGQKSVDKRKGSPKINTEFSKNGQRNPWYDPSKPEGSLIWQTADDLWYAVRKTDKKNNTVEYRTTDGKKITYRRDDKEAAAKYRPVKRTNPDTGEVYFTSADGTLTYKMDKRRQQSTKMYETDDAFDLVSEYRHPMELVYADYANSMKALANQARLEMARTGKIKYDKTAAATYQKEVDELKAALNRALMNSTRERAAQRMATTEISNKKASGVLTDKGDIKKAEQRALSKYREDVGAVSRQKRNIDISDRQWEAIQAGAISEHQLRQILANTDTGKLRERATPRATTNLSTAKVNQIKSLSNSNYTLEQIADKLNISKSVVSKYLKGGK